MPTSTVESLRILDGAETGRAAVPPNRHFTLVRPAMVSSAGTWSAPITPPIGAAYLAAMLVKHGVETTCIDAIAENVDQILREGNYVYQGLTIDETVERIPENTDCIGVSCMFSQDWPYVRELLHRIRERRPRALLIIGGEHATALPEYSLRDCPGIDYVVLGEGEEAIVEIAARLGDKEALDRTPGLAYLRKDGSFVRTPARARIRNVEEIPYPAWDLFPMEVYLNTRNGHGVYRGRTIGVLATRGCPYKCTFCSNPVMYGKAYVPRAPSDVLDEIEYHMHKYNAENFDFYDLTMILKRSWILEFCRMIEERGLKFTWQLPTGTRSEVIDEEVAAALYRTGCRNITYAPESGDPETLDRIKKRVHLPVLTRSIRAALKVGVNVKCNIIIGFPHERRRNVFRTVRFCWKLALMGVHDVGVFMYSPYPGSRLFEELQAEGIVPKTLTKEYFESLVNFMDPTSTTAFCKHISGRELAIWRFFAMASFFALSYLVRPWRFIRFVRNVYRYESDTVLEQRVGAILERFRLTKRPPKPGPAPAASPAVVHASPAAAAKA